MKDIIFVAAPAAGKGTQSARLVDKYNFIHISTGDLLRDEAGKDTELGNKLKEMLATGKLISDEIVNELLEKRINEVKDQPKIFDGYPRTLAQAKLLDSFLKDYMVIYLDVPYEVAAERILGRLTCPKCHKVYNDKSLKPKVPGLCDNCKIELQRRKDDNEETFKERFNEYQENTRPLLDYYEKCGKLVVINGGKSEEEVFNKIKEVVEEEWLTLKVQKK